MYNCCFMGYEPATELNEWMNEWMKSENKTDFRQTHWAENNYLTPKDYRRRTDRRTATVGCTQQRRVAYMHHSRRPYGWRRLSLADSYGDRISDGVLAHPYRRTHSRDTHSTSEQNFLYTRSSAHLSQRYRAMLRVISLSHSGSLKVRVSVPISIPL